MVVERPSLLLLPGLGLGAEAWEPTVRHLQRRDASPRAMVLPLPGYGLPAGPDDDLAPTTLAGAVSDRIAGAGPTVLAGHSASCQVAAHAAARAGGRVCGLALVGPTTDPRALGWTSLARRWLATARHEELRQVPSLWRQYRRTTVRSMARAMNAARYDDIEGTLRQVDCPVLVVRGIHDRICPADWAARLGPTVTLPVGGHMAPLTDGPRVAEVLGHWLAPDDGGDGGAARR
jgi:pimeloyl-ACP methyl ester carboxylesterase